MSKHSISQANRGAWQNRYTFLDKKGRTWLTWFGIHKLYPHLLRETIQQWVARKRARNVFKCRYLVANGRTRFIKSMQIAPMIGRAWGHPTVRVYLRKDIDVIATKMATKTPEKATVRGQMRFVHESVHADDRGEWLTDVQLMKRFGVSIQFCGYWGNRKSRINPKRMALRSKPIPNVIHNKARGELKVFLASDAKDILAGKESKAPGSGRGTNAERLRVDGSQRIKNAVLEIVGKAKQPPDTGYVLEKGLGLGISEYLTRKALDLYCRWDKGQRTNSKVWRPLLDEENGNGRAPGQVPTNGHTAGQRRRGRPKGWRSPEAEQRKIKMLEAWDRGEFGGNKSAAGRRYGFHRSDATKMINFHEAKCRK